MVGVLHPGAMGAAIGSALRPRAGAVIWAAAGRSRATSKRAELADLVGVPDTAAVARRSDVIVSVCPPHAAREVAEEVAVALDPAPGGRIPVYVDANAVSPATVAEIRAVVEGAGGRFVDGGIVGPPPERAGTTRLFLSGAEAETVAAAFAGTVVETPLLGRDPGRASALKMAYAAWTKGTAALVLAIRATARAEGVEDALLAEWARSQPDATGRSEAAADAVARKGWRWIAEMEEIAATFAAAGQPDGFHRAAAEVFRGT